MYNVDNKGKHFILFFHIRSNECRRNVWDIESLQKRIMRVTTYIGKNSDIFKYIIMMHVCDVHLFNCLTKSQIG